MPQVMVFDKGAMRPAAVSELAQSSFLPFEAIDTVAAGLAMGTDNFVHGGVFLRNGQTTAVSDTLPTGAQMDIDNPNFPVGAVSLVNWLNQGAFQQTLVAAAGFNLPVGGLSIPAGGSALMRCQHTGVNTWSLQVYDLAAGGSSALQAVVRTVSAAATAILATDLNQADIIVRSGAAVAVAEVLPTGAVLSGVPKFAQLPVSGVCRMEYSNQNTALGVVTFTPSLGVTVVGNVAGIAVGTTRPVLVTRLSAAAFQWEIL